MNMNEIYVCMTTRHVFYAIWLILSRKSMENALVLICTNHQEISDIEINIDFIEGLGVKIHLVDESEIERKFKDKNLIYFIPYIGRYYSLYYGGFNTIYNNIAKQLGSFDLINTKVFSFHDRNLITKYFLKSGFVTLIEDGLANYIEQKNKLLSLKTIARIFLGYHPLLRIMGEHKKINKILLTKPENCHFKIKTKVCNLLCDLNFNQNILDILPKLFYLRSTVSSYYNDGTIIFLTQPLDCASFCTKTRKIEVYENIIKKLLSKFKDVHVVIKPHPNEITSEYDKLYLGSLGDRVSIIKGSCPLEALSLSQGFSNLKVISLYTSAEFFYNSHLHPVNNLIGDVKVWSSHNIDLIERIAIENISEIIE